MDRASPNQQALKPGKNSRPGTFRQVGNIRNLKVFGQPRQRLGNRQPLALAQLPREQIDRRQQWWREAGSGARWPSFQGSHLLDERLILGYKASEAL
jgi:hypothetical protein